MKKYIFIALALLCGTTIMAQQPVQRTKKVMVFHLTDGTQIRNNLYFYHDSRCNSWGKHEVNDNDYVRISNISGTNDFHKVNVELPYSGVDNMGEIGVRWSTNRDEIINGGYEMTETIEWDSDSNPIYTYNIDFTEESPIVYDIPYYFRAYTTILGKTYYSSVQEYIFRLEISQHYPYEINADAYKETGFVVPSDEAFTKAFCQEGGALSNAALNLLKKEWNSAYITPELAAAINKTDAEQIICYECNLYIINSVPEDFVQHIMGDEMTFVAGDQLNDDVDESDKPLFTDKVAMCELIECNESFGVYDNRYWKYLPSGTNANPTVGIDMPFTVPGYTYNVSIVFAPETNDTITALPHKLRLNMFETNEEGELPKRGTAIKDTEGSSTFITDNATKCDTVSFEWEATDIRRCLLQIQPRVTSREEEIYTRTLRVVGVFVERKQK